MGAESLGRKKLKESLRKKNLISRKAFFNFLEIIQLF
jgi:hypothetical protein